MLTISYKIQFSGIFISKYLVWEKYRHVVFIEYMSVYFDSKLTWFNPWAVTYFTNNFLFIMKTCLYNFDPLKPHFYIVKLGFTGVYIIFLISAQKHRLWVLVRTASASIHNLCFEQKYGKYQSFLPENFRFLEVKFSIYLNRRVFVMLYEGYWWVLIGRN